jgi:hypothetical protein
MYTNNEINEKMVILEKFRKNIKFGHITRKKYLLQHLIADKRRNGNFFI